MSARYGEILARNRSYLDLGTASSPMGSAEKHDSINGLSSPKEFSGHSKLIFLSSQSAHFLMTK